MSFLEKFRHSKFYGWLDFLAKNAMFALLLTLGLFLVEQIINNVEQREITKTLKEIHDAASTRFLGRFPDYLGEINKVMDTAKDDEEVIVFEDVLYYGFLSEPTEFKRLNHTLVERAKKNKVTIAYYDVDGIAFHLMLIDELIGEERESGTVTDSTIREKNFRAKRDKDFKSFEDRVKKYRKPLHQKTGSGVLSHLFRGNRKLLDSLQKTPLFFEFEALYARVDSVKTFYMGDENKDVRNITFADYKKMYQGISREIIQFYQDHNPDNTIELIPLNDYLTMSCWMVGKRAVIAFPSRYSTDEIGFFSQDKAFSDYIHTMLDGVRREDLIYSRPASH